MIQLMMATISGSPAARHARNPHDARDAYHAQRQLAFTVRHAIGMAIVGSGFAVLASDALQRVLGG